MEAVISFFEKLLSYRGIAIVLAYLLFIVLVFGAMIFIVPFILSQLSDIMTIMIGNISHFQNILATKSLISIVQDTHRIP